MTRLCFICTHEQRPAIEEALFVGGESLRDIASRFSLSKSSLQRHQAHLGAGEDGAELLEDLAESVAVEEEDYIEPDPHGAEEEEETTLENQTRLITKLQGKREKLSRELREVDDLLELCDKRDKANHARSLLLQARFLAQEAIAEARAEEQTRLERELAELLPHLEERQAALEAVQQQIAALEASSRSCPASRSPKRIPKTNGSLRQRMFPMPCGRPLMNGVSRHWTSVSRPTR